MCINRISTVEIRVTHTIKIARVNPSVDKTFDGTDNRNEMFLILWQLINIEMLYELVYLLHCCSDFIFGMVF